MRDVDTWDKPRSHGEHLTETEIAFIRDSFVNRYPIKYTAEKLKCSSRVVTKYYGYFRAEGVEQKRSRI